jgi:hypothetical protein
VAIRRVAPTATLKKFVEWVRTFQHAEGLFVVPAVAHAGLLDVLWSPPTYERLIGAWNLDNAEAIGAVQWLIAKVIAAVEDNEGPLPQ